MLVHGAGPRCGHSGRGAGPGAGRRRRSGKSPETPPGREMTAPRVTAPPSGTGTARSGPARHRLPAPARPDGAPRQSPAPGGCWPQSAAPRGPSRPGGTRAGSGVSSAAAPRPGPAHTETPSPVPSRLQGVRRPCPHPRIPLRPPRSPPREHLPYSSPAAPHSPRRKRQASAARPAPAWPWGLPGTGPPGSGSARQRENTGGF